MRKRSRKHGLKLVVRKDLRLKRIKIMEAGLRQNLEDWGNTFSKYNGEVITASDFYARTRKRGSSYRTFIPIPSVGCYIPGGQARYPSSVVMSVVPARKLRALREL